MPSFAKPNVPLQQLQRALDEPRHPKLSDERFDEAHERFERSSNQQDLIRSCLTEFIRNFPGEESLRILSVGCGSGILDNPLLTTVGMSRRLINYTGIDPNPVACERFREEFDQLQLRSVQLEVRQETVESISCEKKFDIIHAVHSLYYFNDPADAIERLLGKLNKGGKLVIFQAPKAELNQLAECFWFHDQDVDIWFSERLQRHIVKTGLEFTQSRIDGQVDVTSCFDPSSSNGSLILDFVTQVECQKLNTTTRESLLECLDSIAEKSGDQILVPHPVDVFEISL